MKRHLSIQNIFWMCILFLFSYVLFSAVRSGFFYQIDNDEMYHSQIAYLLDHGSEIYTSFYTTYTPLFYWILTPFFKLVGYGVQNLSFTRGLMVGFFLLRLVFIYLSVKTLLSWKAGLLGLLFLILDPFAVMSAMQIRPDTVMLLLYSMSLYVYILARTRQSRMLFLCTGVFAALSVAMLMKILPSVAVLLAVATVSSWQRKRLKEEGIVLVGFFVTLAVLCIVWMMLGLFDGIIQQTILDPFVVFGVLLYPVHYGFYLKEGNMWVYGPWTRPIAWVYAQLILPLGGFGIFSGLDAIKNKSINPLFRDVLLVLIGALVTQWLWLITVPSIFIQYYLPVNWIIAVLGGIGVYYLLDIPSKNKKLMVGVYALCIVVIGTFSYGNIKTNSFRGNIRSAETEKRLELLWKAIPEDRAVFPSVLFRPIAYPIPYQVYFTELPPDILSRFPSVSESLERYNVQYMYNHPGIITSLPPADQEYIRSRFVPGGIDDEVFVRKTEL